MGSHRDTLQSFSLNTVPTLDVAVLGALELFKEQGVPALPTLPHGRLLIVGSVNAGAAGRILGQGRDALFADESDYREVFEHAHDIAAVVLISASGGKHAVEIARYFKERSVRTILITHNTEALAKEFVTQNDIVVFPKNREPYTYNTSTYLGVILAATQESPDAIYTYIEQTLTPQLPTTFGSYDAFFITVPSRFHLLAPMLLAKFDELFAPRVSGRVFTEDHAKHATTVIPSPTECFISLGTDLAHIAPTDRLVTVPILENLGYGSLMAISYFVIGTIQKQHPPYFQNNIVDYCKRASTLFGQEIKPIVE